MKTSYDSSLRPGSYDSIREVRYFCKHGGRTIEGSVPISELPTLKEQGYMYALKQKHKDGLVLVRVDGHLCDIHGEIKWFRHYLEAEEYCQKVSYDVEAIEASEILKFALNLCKVKEARIKQLLNEVIELQQTINPDLVKYHPDNFNHMHSVDSLEGIKPEHSYEEDPT